MEYFNRFRSTVTQVAEKAKNALPGNPITREYEIGEQVGSAGPGLYWKIYNGVKYSSKQPVAVWMFDKKDIEKWPKDDKEMFISVIKKGVAQLTRLRHPRLLIIEHPIEESRDSLAFTTEPVFTSLANVVGNIENFSSSLPPHLRDFKLLDVEIKHGLFQLGEALTFLHIDLKMIHRNICPSSVIINDKGAWKLAGFDFAVQGQAGANSQYTYEGIDWTERLPSVCQPVLDYIAPEYICGGSCNPNSDIFSLGSLSFAVFNRGKAPMDHKNRRDMFETNMEKLKSFPQQFLANIPAVFVEDFKMCLNYLPDLRPDATQFTKIAYFDDPLVRALNYFESLMQMDNSQKMQFFKSLPNVLTKFDKRPLLQKVMPFLSGEFSTPDLIPFILPSVFLIAEMASKQEFSDAILPVLVPLFTMQRPYQVALLLLQKMELLLEKTSEEDIKKHVLPLIYNSICSETTRIQELCLSIVPNIGKLVDRQSMKTQMLPKLLKLATDGTVLSVSRVSKVRFKIGRIIITLSRLNLTRIWQNFVGFLILIGNLLLVFQVLLGFKILHYVQILISHILIFLKFFQVWRCSD
ncbi:hypothetical protein WR25_03618 [Diploscapter pachys]|uniref:Protein kinase domain-containing protein n=1 Tax=Diploscapter pachys TaxID=2018661 RepID=A0A2A2J273_9BILA|nr:hypothetical protein WR25_03618 [Diploscapter pachys]